MERKEIAHRPAWRARLLWLLVGASWPLAWLLARFIQHHGLDLLPLALAFGLTAWWLFASRSGQGNCPRCGGTLELMPVSGGPLGNERPAEQLCRSCGCKVA